MATSSRRGLESTASNPMTGRVAEMKPTPRSPRLGAFADAMLAVRDFINKAQIPQGVPLIGGEGLGSLILGRAPEELIEMSYGNMPVRVNPMAGRTASFVPEVKPGRSAQVADLLSLAGVPGGGRMAAAATGGLADFGTGAERAMLAYHGTPHRFERFNASKIGTGEGAQAYGHGIYFAESPDVARSYQKALTFDGFKIKMKDGSTQIAARGTNDGFDPGAFLTKHGGDYDAAIKDAEFYLGSDSIVRQLKTWKQNSVETIAFGNKGSLYTVDIPDEMIPRVLDWDKPLSQQTPEVRKAIQGIMQSDIWDADIRKLVGDVDIKGKIFYELLSGVDAFAGKGEFGKAASKALRDAGIPGIRYLDEGSRGAGQGTSNFVVFPGEEQRVRILKRE